MGRTKQLIFEGTNVTKKVYATAAYEIRETLLNPAETNRALKQSANNLPLANSAESTFHWQWEMDFVRIYVDTPAGKIGIYQQEGSTNGVGSVTRHYMHKDHLGSVVAVSDDDGDITHRSYDAWGRERDATDWSPLSDPITDNLEQITDRGYTGHEMLSGLDLIHMNGRIYDPVIGRMISPDPLIQAPENLQSFNRYSYVFNNPLTHTDPSGFETEEKKSQAEAATASTQLAENVSSTEISSQDNVGGEEGEATKQEEDFSTDVDGIAQLDKTQRPAEQQTGTDDKLKPPMQTPPTDLKAYGLATNEFMEEGVDPVEGNHAKFAGKDGTKTEQHTEGKNKWGGSKGEGYTNLTKDDESKSKLSGADYHGVKDAFEVYVHGDGEGGFKGEDENPLTVDQVYAQMEEDGYTPGQPIILISCGAGLGSENAAQELATLSGATVVASQGKTYSEPGYRYTSRSNDDYGEGPKGWYAFKPDGSSRTDLKTNFIFFK